MNGVIGIVFDNSGRVLLQKRRDVPIWSLPGGGIEKGESLEEATIREIEEETGIKSKVIRQIGEYTFKSGQINYFFECKQIGGKPTTSNESSDVNFFSVKDLPKPYSPIVPQLINDALQNNKNLIKRHIKIITPKIAFRYLLTSPEVAIKYILKALKK